MGSIVMIGLIALYGFYPTIDNLIWDWSIPCDTMFVRDYQISGCKVIRTSYILTMCQLLPLILLIIGSNKD